MLCRGLKAGDHEADSPGANVRFWQPTFTTDCLRPRLCENVVGSRLEHFIVTRIEYFVSPA